MKKILVVLSLLALSLLGSAQSVPTTPNIGLYIPLHGTPNWDLYVNSNSNMLDSFLSGGTSLPFLHLGKQQLDSYQDFAAISAPANPPSGFCRVYFDLGVGQWKGINSAGANCSPNGVPTGASFAMAYFDVAGNLNSDACTTDGAGNLVCTSIASIGPGTAKIDFPEGVSPGNPSAATHRIYADSTTHVLTCLTSSGGNCLVPFASPAFTGTPTAPTAAVDTNTTQIATTAFVLGQAAAVNPLMNGTVAIGTSTRYARADHVHPVDTSRAPLASPTFTGTVTIPLEASATNCASSGGTCGAAPAGRVSIAAAATTVTVATTAVTANSEIMVTEDSTLGAALSVTCNTTTGRTYTITTRTAGTSFVITASAAPAVDPACLSYRIIN